MLEMDRQATKYRYGVSGVRAELAAAAAKLPGNCHPPEEHSMPLSPGHTTRGECPISELPKVEESRWAGYPQDGIQNDWQL